MLQNSSMTTTTITEKEKLSVQLREQTATRHQAAEGASILTLLFAKKLEQDRYRNYLRSLHYIYTALESGLQQERSKSDPFLSLINFPELFRVSALEADLLHFGGAQWKSLPVANAAKRHGDRITQLFEKEPHRVPAHAYVRYLGDLSGGQMIGKVVAESYGEEGTAFYKFEKITSPGAMKQRFRDALDSLPLNDVQRKEVIDEACVAFDLSGELLQQL
jgi:heme oxygenase